MLDITLQGEQMSLLAERALLWPSEKTLIVSDLHWGKSGHFRKHGIAIPGSTQQQDEIKLANLIRKHNVERLIIAGDLFHSKQNNEVDGFTYWRDAHASLSIHLVAGNHDILPVEKYQSWNLILHEKEFTTGPFLIVHDAPETCEQFCIHGHIHPAMRVTGIGRQAAKLCCFAQDEHRMILPAFGQFTGTHLLEPGNYKHIYLIADDEVIQWK